MSKRYTDDYKKIACQLLQTNGGSVALTSRQTGVPPRTLREWRQHYPHQSPENNVRRQPMEEQLQLLRERMMDQAVTLANDLSSDPDPLALNQRVMALTRLIDRLVRLDGAYPPPRTEADIPLFRVVYVDEHGKQWDSPPDLEEGDERGDL